MLKAVDKFMFLLHHQSFLILVLMSPSPVLPNVHNKKMKNLLSYLDVDLEHDFTGHKLHKHCE